MNDEQLLRDLGSWLKDTDADHPDAERITARAMTEVPRVRQRGRWWPLPDLGGLGGRRSRKPRPVGSTLPMGSQPVPALPIGDQPLTASGPTVFSALRFVTAGVIVGLFGGFLLAGVLTTQQLDKVPAAVTEPPSPMTTDSLLSRAADRGGRAWGPAGHRRWRPGPRLGRQHQHRQRAGRRHLAAGGGWLPATRH